MCPEVGAWHLDNQPFGFRLLVTQDRNSGFAPVAHPVFSINPAADDFLRDPPSYKAVPGIALEWTGLEAGGWVSTESLLSYLRPAEEGTFLGIYGRTDVYDSKTRQGEIFDLDGDAFTLRYSRHLSQTITLGGGVKVTRSKAMLKAADAKVESTGVESEFTLGLLAGLNPQWTAGFLVTQAPLWSNTKFVSDGTTDREKATTHLTRVRGGVGWKPRPTLGLYADAEYLRVSSDGASMNSARGILFGEYFLTPTLALRLGTVVDSAAKVTYNFGVGYYGLKGVNFDVAYSHNAFAEVAHEFGKTDYLLLIVSTSF